MTINRWMGVEDVVHISSVQPLITSNSLWPHELQHARPPCPSLTTGIYSNSCSLSWQYHPTISSSVVPLSSHIQSFPAIRIFSKDSAFCIKWPKYWSFSFSISPWNEYSGLISIGWTSWISLQSKGLSRVFSSTKIQKNSFLVLSFFHSPTLTSIHDHWKNHSLD